MKNKSEKELLIFTLLNAGIINVTWWFLFVYITRGVEGIKKEGFKDYFGYFIVDLYAFSIFVALLLLFLILVILKSNARLGRAFFSFASWLCIISPFFGLIYWMNFSYWMMVLYNSFYLDNVQIIVGFLLALGISYFHLHRSKRVFRETV